MDYIRCLLKQLYELKEEVDHAMPLTTTEPEYVYQRGRRDMIMDCLSIVENRPKHIPLMEWHNVLEELPIVEDIEEFEDIPFLGIFWSYGDYEEGYLESGEEPEKMGIIYYYGNNHWKNNRWETVYPKYWLEIPIAP